MDGADSFEFSFGISCFICTSVLTYLEYAFFYRLPHIMIKHTICIALTALLAMACTPQDTLDTFILNTKTLSIYPANEETHVFSENIKLISSTPWVLLSQTTEGLTLSPDFGPGEDDVQVLQPGITDALKAKLANPNAHFPAYETGKGYKVGSFRLSGETKTEIVDVYYAVAELKFEGSIVAAGSQMVRIGSPIKLPTAGEVSLIPPAGHVFYRWNTLPSGKGVNYRPGDEISLFMHTTLYPIWNKDGSSNAGPNEIYTPEELAAIAASPKEDYILMKDLELANWETIENTFTGKFDGNGFRITIKNLNQPTDINHFNGIFSIIGPKGIVKNLNVSVDANIIIDNTACLGVIASSIHDGTISHCNVNGKLLLNGATSSMTVGGIVGFVIGTSFLEHVHTDIDININTKGLITVGGIVGILEGAMVEKASAKGTICAKGGGGFVGGIVGSMVPIPDEWVASSSPWSGGVVRNATPLSSLQPPFPSIQNAYSDMTISFTGDRNLGSFVGGIAGAAIGDIQNVYALQDVSVKTIGGIAVSAGGIFGAGDVSLVQKAFACGIISAISDETTSIAGGIGGIGNGISDCVALNPSVLNANILSRIARNDRVEPPFSNNFARSDMGGGPWSDKGASRQDGADCPANPTKDWWTGVAGWVFDGSPWAWDTASNLPKLVFTQ